MLNEKYQTLQISEQARLANARVVSPARVPMDPVSPNKKLNLALACVVGALLAVGAALAIDYNDDTIHCADDVTAATALSAVLDGVRTASFLGLGLWVGWHNRRWTQVAVIFGLPLGFFLTLFGPNFAAALGGGSGLGLATVLVGEVVFGVVAGTTYYAALYYAMVVKNAAVEAGGAHEGLIGAGFAIGPLAGLAGGWIAPLVGGPVAGMAVGIAPIIVVSSVGAVWFLAKCGSSRRDAA